MSDCGHRPPNPFSEFMRIGMTSEIDHLAHEISELRKDVAAIGARLEPTTSLITGRAAMDEFARITRMVRIVRW